MLWCAGVRYPLAVKLGTITPNGADVYSYAQEEDSMVKVSKRTLRADKASGCPGSAVALSLSIPIYPVVDKVTVKVLEGTAVNQV